MEIINSSLYVRFLKNEIYHEKRSLSLKYMLVWGNVSLILLIIINNMLSAIDN